MMSNIPLKSLVLEVLKVSEKAANLARILRSEGTLFELLVQEKTGDELSKRFVHDFKTLADVLVQETVRHELGRKFNQLVDNIRGEESNKFRNTLGESVVVTIQDSEAATAELLCLVLDGNAQAAELLSGIVHQDLDFSIADESSFDKLGSTTLSEESIGIWIDPIDSTAEYIRATDGSVSTTGIHRRGLRCVTVLIGVYELASGRPLFGCINQPFVHRDPQSREWSGQYVWGVSYQGLNVYSTSSSLPDAVVDTELAAASRSVVLSTSEKVKVQRRLSNQFSLEFAAGAGYKILCVVEGLAALYVLSLGYTFKWDTCAPHAILLAQGGGIVDLRRAVDATRSHGRTAQDVAADCQLVYNQPGQADSDPESMDCWSNDGGLIAYHDISTLADVLACLSSSDQ